MKESLVYKKSMNKKNGVTLMILIITIILILILSSAILVILNVSNPIGEGRETKLRSDIQTMKDNYDIVYNDLLFKNAGNKNKIKDSDFKKVIPDKYKDDFVANKDGIDYIGDDDEIKEIAEEMGLGPKDDKTLINIAATGNVTSVEIEVIVKDDTNVDEYIYYIREVGEEEWKEYRSPDNKIEIDGLKEKTKYEVKVEIVRDGKPEESEIIEVITKELEAGKIIMKLNDKDGDDYIDGTWTKENVYIEVEGEKTTYTATGDNTVDKTSDPSTLTNEGVTKVIVETKDGESVITKEYTIMIDKEPPDGRLEKEIIPKGPFNGDVIITVKDPTDNLSGIKEYEFYINGEPRAVTKDNKYTFENLEKGKYEIKVVIVDKANNKKELITNIVVGVPDANDEEKVQVRKDPTTWTNGNVTLTVTFTAEDMYIPQYSEDGITWTDIDRVFVKVIEINKKVYVRYRYEDIPDFGGEHREIVIDNIDKVDPEIISLVPSTTDPINEDIKIIGKAIDPLSGIIAYQFSTDGSLTATSGGWTTIANTREEMTQEYNISENGTYYFYVKDEAENISKKEIVVQNIDKIKPTVKIEPNGGTYVIPVGSTDINISAKLTAEDEGTSNLDILQYQFSTSTEAPSDDDANWKNFTNEQTVTDAIGGGTHYLYTKVIDGAKNRAEQIKKSDKYIVKYQVKYDPNNGVGVPDEQTKIHDEKLTLSETTPTRKGHTFRGWSTDKDATTPEYTAGGEYTINSSVLLYAVWEINKYNVTYNFGENGGASATKTTDIITYMQPIDLSPTATKAEYDFIGWNTDKDATEGLTSLTMDAEDVVLYAIYRKKFTGTFNYFDGTQALSKTVSDYAYNKATTVTIATPTIANTSKDGRTFTQRGWSTSDVANATINVESGNDVTLSTDTTYYASYALTVTAIFNYYENKIATSTTTKYMNYIGEYIEYDIEIPASVSSSSGPSNTTYLHVATTKTGSAVTPTIDNGTTYYAVYKRTVTATKYVYNNSGTTVTGTGYGYYDGTVANATLNLGTTSLNNYTFRGWSTSTEANATINVEANGNASIIDDTNYYASYSQSQTATFYYYPSKSATSSGTRYMNYVGTFFQGEIAVPLAVSSSIGPSSIGYSYVATSKTGTAVTPTTETLVYYAVYTKTVTVTKYVYNNSATTATGTAYGYYDGAIANASINLGTTSLDNYTFRGWSTSTEANATINVAANGSVSIINDIAYYASYSQSFTATFYYYQNQTATSSETRYLNYAGTFIHANLPIPDVVFSSSGPQSTIFSHIATSKTGEAVMPTTEYDKYYIVYAKTVKVTKYTYNNQSSTASGRAYGYYDNTYSNASINLGTTSLNGYTFRGWSTSNAANATINVAANGNASVINDTVYYASYSYTVYIYYNVNGGSGSVAATSGTAYMNYRGSKIAGSVSVTSSKATRSGYLFQGWYTDYDGGLSVSGTYSLTASMTVYAHWIIDKTAWIEIENQADAATQVTLYTTGRSITQVVFPVWTTANGQDDIEWIQGDRSTWGDNGYYYFTCWVLKSNHNFEGGQYNVHAYRGTAGNTIGGTLDGTTWYWGDSYGGGGTVTPPSVVSHTCNTENYCTTIHTHTSYWSCTCGGSHIQYRHPMCSICGKRSPVSWWKCPNSPEGSPMTCAG